MYPSIKDPVELKTIWSNGFIKAHIVIRANKDKNADWYYSKKLSEIQLLI